MKHFSVGQKWVARDAIFGTFFGEVTEVSDDGKSGIIVITDDRGNVLDTFSGSAADFQTSGEWQLADQSPPAATHPPPHPKEQHRGGRDCSLHSRTALAVPASS